MFAGRAPALKTLLACVGPRAILFRALSSSSPSHPPRAVFSSFLSLPSPAAPCRPFAAAAAGGKKPLKNAAIPFQNVSLVDLDGKMLGEMRLEDALAVARSQSPPVDVVLVTAAAKPSSAPVCRLRAKVEKVRVGPAVPVRVGPLKEKEMRYSSRIAEHDLETKCRKVEGFLAKGHVVRLQVGIQGSDLWTKQEIERRGVMRRVVEYVIASGVGWVDSDLKASGPYLNGIAKPLPKHKKKTKEEMEAVLQLLSRPIGTPVLLQQPAPKEATSSGTDASSGETEGEEEGAQGKPRPPVRPPPSRAEAIRTGLEPPPAEPGYIHRTRRKRK